MATFLIASATKKLMADAPELFPVASRVRQARQAMGLSQQALAAAAKISQKAVSMIETGNVRRPASIREIAKAVGRSEAWLLAETDDDSASLPPPNASAPEAVRMSRERLPVYGQGVGGVDGRFILNGQKLGDVFCPPILQGVPNAYAVYIYGSSMEDRYFAGEVAWVHPYQPVVSKEFVVVQIRPAKRGDLPYGYVKQFISLDPTELVLRQLNPKDFLRFPSKDVISVHKIVFSGAA